MKAKFILYFLPFLLLAVSCQKSLDGELKAYEANIKKLDALSSKYPSFRTAVEIVKKDAAAQFETAKKLSEEKSKIEGISAANKIARPAFLNNIDEIEKLLRNLPNKFSEATQKAFDENDKEAAKIAIRTTEDDIYDTKARLQNARMSSPNEANAVTDEILTLLKSAETRLDKVMETSDSKRDDQKTSEAKKDSQKAADSKPVKCGHCGKVCDPGTSSCKSCGAPLS